MSSTPSTVPLFRSYERKTLKSPSYDASLPLNIIDSGSSILALTCYTKVANTNQDSVVQREQSCLVLNDLSKGEIISDNYIRHTGSVLFSEWNKLECLCYHAIPELNAVLVSFASGDLVLFKLESSPETKTHKKLRIWTLDQPCVSMDAFHHQKDAEALLEKFVNRNSSDSDNDTESDEGMESDSDAESDNSSSSSSSEKESEQDNASSSDESTSEGEKDSGEAVLSAESSEAVANGASINNGLDFSTYDTSKFNGIVALGFSNGSVRLLNVITGEFVDHMQSELTGRIHYLRFITEEVLCVGEMHGMRLWNVAEKTCTEYVVDSTVTDVRAIGQDRFVVTCGNRNLTIHNLEGSLIRAIPLFDTVMQLLVLPKSLFNKSIASSITSSHGIITFSEEGYIRVYDATNKRKDDADYTAPLDELKPSFSSVHYSPAQNVIVAGTDDADILYFDPKTLKRTRQHVGFNDSVLDLCVNTHQGANDLIVATTASKILMIDRKTQDNSFLIGHTDAVTSITNGIVGGVAILASGSRDRTVRVWDLEEKKCVALCDTHTDAITAVAMNTTTGNFLISVGEDTVMKKYNLKQVKEHMRAWKGKPIPDESLLLMANDSRKVHEKDVNDIDISVNGKFIATASYDKKVKIWNADDLNLVDTFTHRKGVWSVRFSPTEKCVATGCADFMIRIWSLTTHTCIKVLEGHAQHVIRLAYLNRGTQLMSSTTSGIMKLWNIKNGECLESFDEHSDRVWALRSMNDGKEIISGSEDRTIITWNENTRERAVNQKREKDEAILQEQKLKNLIRNKEYVKAITMAISLDQPRRSYTLIEELLVNNVNGIFDVIAQLEHKLLMRLFEYAIDWNTNARFSHVAHCIFFSMFNKLNPKFVSWNYEKSVDSILAYSEKHSNRVSSLLESSYILDYILHQMKVLLPEDEIVDFERSVESTTYQKLDVFDPDEVLLGKRKREEDDEYERHIQLERKEKLEKRRKNYKR